MIALTASVGIVVKTKGEHIKPSEIISMWKEVKG